MREISLPSESSLNDYISDKVEILANQLMCKNVSIETFANCKTFIQVDNKAREIMFS